MVLRKSVTFRNSFLWYQNIVHLHIWPQDLFLHLPQTRAFYLAPAYCSRAAISTNRRSKTRKKRPSARDGEKKGRKKVGKEVELQLSGTTNSARTNREGWPDRVKPTRDPKPFFPFRSSHSLANNPPGQLIKFTPRDGHFSFPSPRFCLNAERRSLGRFFSSARLLPAR